MSVLVFIESAEGEIKKSSFEAVGYAAEVAKTSGGEVTAVAFGNLSEGVLAELGKYGAQKVLHADDNRMEGNPVQACVTLLQQAAEKTGAKIIVLTKSSLTDAIAGRVAARLKASLVSNVVALPETGSGFTVKRSIYTGKAFAQTEMKGDIKMISLKKNAFSPQETGGSASVEKFSPSFSDNDFAVRVTSVDKATGDVLLPEAEIVVSGGRGLKGPENWNLVEDLAKVLGAATACSKPVSDADWRPHHEHVGQTGIKVSPNLYIAIGISGAIQHLAGVNSSKVIVVINKDADAPFFKAADYGIVGDAFEIVPKLTEAFRSMN
jgi:electron transfer flavoprotein alpha subunit